MTTTTDGDTGTQAGAGRGRLAAVGDGATDAYRAARERTAAVYDTARGAGRRAADGIEANPVAAVIGGLAIGAIVAALLPKSRREDALLGDVGRRITDTAREAARAARDAGREQIGELGLSRDALHRKLDDFTDRAVDAVKDTVKGRREE